MNYQDNKRVNTAEELRRMYNLDGLVKDRKAIANSQNRLTRIEAEQESILKSIIINLDGILEDQSDISLWFFTGVPTLQNEPAVDWTNLSEHTGDFYYDKSTGYVYEFTGTSWEQQYDADLIQAMALTNAELDTEDGERKIFFSTPSPPYNDGDWYVQDGDVYICQVSKTSTEIYDASDFVIASKYASNREIYEVERQLSIVSNQVNSIYSIMEQVVAQATFNLILTNVNTVFNFDDITVHNSSFVRVSNNTIEVLKNGLYRVSIQSRFNDVTQGLDDSVAIGVATNQVWNDNTVCYGCNNLKLSLNVPILISLQAGDKLSIAGFSQNGGTANGNCIVEYVKGG